MKKYSALLLVLLLMLVFTGCEQVFDFRPTGNLEGYVTDGRGGPGVEGAEVKALGSKVKTDEDGYFEMEAWADQSFDLIVIKDERGLVRVQDLRLEEDQTKMLELPSRRAFNPDWSRTPPNIEVDGVQRGEVVSGDLEIEFSVEGDRPTFVYYVNFGGVQRGPRESFAVDTDEGQAVIDTTRHPNGDSFIRILAYDDNDNAVVKFIPVVVDNDIDEGDPPADLDWIGLISMTLGKNFGYYSDQREMMEKEMDLDIDPDIYETPEGQRVDISSIPDDSSLSIEVQWSPVPEADGYAVYRSFDGNSYEHIGNITQYVDISDEDEDPILVGQYNDFSPQLGLKETYYKVEPYNAYGEGQPLTRSIEPLAPYNVVLENPAHEATDVELMPTFSWDLDIEGEWPEEAVLIHGISVFDATDWLVAEDVVVNADQYPLPFELDPLTVYSWDIFYSEAYVFEEDAEGFTDAVSMAGEMAGSLMGEFIFTTGDGE